MNRGELKDEFRTRVFDTVKPYLWPDKEIDPWFSEAEAEAAIRSRLILDTEEFGLAAGDSPRIDLPSALFDIQYAELRDASGNAYPIEPSSRGDQDKYNRKWRQNIERPTFYIHDDKALVLNAIPDQAYTLYIEFFRKPSNAMADDNESPEIAEIHHLGLVDWVEFRAYSKPDVDTLNPGKAKDAEGRFIASFGKRPSADLRRRQNANRPHRNRLHS